MAADDRLLRLVTANAASGRDRRGRLDHGRWAAAAGEVQRHVDADLWAVQEVDHRLARSGSVDQTAELGEVLRADGEAWHSRFTAAVHGEPGSTAGVRPATQQDPLPPSYGIAVHCRPDVLDHHELHLPPSRLRVPLPLPPGSGTRVLWVADEPRVVSATVVRGRGGPVSVVTTHLSFVPWQARLQLRRLLGWAESLPRPLVLLGDLNLAGRTPVRLTGLQSPDPGGTAPTHPASRPRRRIDHVLLDPGDAPLGLVELGTPRVGESDHRGVVVDLVPRAHRHRAVGAHG